MDGNSTLMISAVSKSGEFSSSQAKSSRAIRNPISRILRQAASVEKAVALMQPGEKVLQMTARPGYGPAKPLDHTYAFYIIGKGGVNDYFFPVCCGTWRPVKVKEESYAIDSRRMAGELKDFNALELNQFDYLLLVGQQNDQEKLTAFRLIFSENKIELYEKS